MVKEIGEVLFGSNENEKAKLIDSWVIESDGNVEQRGGAHIGCAKNVSRNYSKSLQSILTILI